MLATAQLCSRPSANAMRSPCLARPFFSQTEQDEIALLAQATCLRRAATQGPVAGPGLPAYGYATFAVPLSGHGAIGQIGATQGILAA